MPTPSPAGKSTRLAVRRSRTAATAYAPLIGSNRNQESRHGDHFAANHQQYLAKNPYGYRCHANTGVRFPATA